MTAGCASQKTHTSQITKATDAVNLSDGSTVRENLLEQHIDWKGTPYRTGGLSKRGVDCSGFVYLTFRSKLGYDIPRTTESQVSLGNTVDRRSLRSGDLVFFKTGLFSRHVGIYLNDSKFLHASSSKGVIVSSLEEWYWQKHYWTAKRLN